MPHADEDAAARQRMRSGGSLAYPETITDRPWNAACTRPPGSPSRASPTGRSG
jgi:hypothetical protein